MEELIQFLVLRGTGFDGLGMCGSATALFSQPLSSHLTVL